MSRYHRRFDAAAQAAEDRLNKQRGMALKVMKAEATTRLRSAFVKVDPALTGTIAPMHIKSALASGGLEVGEIEAWVINKHLVNGRFRWLDFCA